MAATRVSLAIGRNDLLCRPILAGSVVPRGIELELPEYEGIEPMSVRMAKGLEFDVATMSISTFVKARSEGAPLVALPVFTARYFVQPHLHLSKRSPVRDLSELKGRRVGLHVYWNSMAVWGRSILWRVHGVPPQDITWITARPERLESQGFPPGVEVEQNRFGRDTAEQMLYGEVEAVIGLGPGGLPQEAGARTGYEITQGIRRDAYPDLVGTERAFYRQTGVLPMTNLIVMREELATQQPWVVESLYELFVVSKQEYGLAKALEEFLPGPHSPLRGGTVADVQELFGEDPWPYNIRDNRKTLDTFLAEAFEQGLTNSRVPVEQLFPPNLPDAAR